MSDFLRTAAPVLARQQSLITSAQCIELGADSQLLTSLVRRSVWARVARGLYGPAGVALTWRRRVMAAWLLAPGGSLISHRAAAHLLGVGGFAEPPSPEISIPRRTNLRRRGVIVHESKDLALARPLVIDGIPCTRPERLAVDLGRVVSPSRYVHIIRELRHGHGVSSDELLRSYLRHKRQGRNGCGALRDWLDRYFDISGVPESGLEQLVVDALIDAGFDDFCLQLEIATSAGRYRVDIAFRNLRIIVEVDGAQHRDLDIAAADRPRTVALEAAGWRVLRIRSGHLASDLAAALRVIRSVVLSRADGCEGHEIID